METWHTSHEDVSLRCCVPAGCMCQDAAQLSTDLSRTKTGGVADITSISDELDSGQQSAEAGHVWVISAGGRVLLSPSVCS